ncbi:MAG TPA: hypothetical protein VLJ17_22755 [Xanthobacteraceae bacterium]|nr:hypothetical protein [Xanthobacteraceae bacterium]
MWRGTLAIALITIGSFFISLEGIGMAPAAAQDVMVTDAQITQLKSVLKLTLAQERLWRPVETALRALLDRRVPQETVAAGFVHRARTRVAGLMLNAVALRRLASVAQPLINSLDQRQKDDGLTFMRTVGMASLF